MKKIVLATACILALALPAAAQTASPVAVRRARATSDPARRKAR